METSEQYKQALDAFMHRMITHVRNGLIRDVMEQLEEGPAGLEPNPENLRLHEWFRELDQEFRENIKQVVTDAVDGTIFSTCVVLDGAAGGYPIPGVISDFALYLQTYANDDEYRANKAQEAIRINPPNTNDDLHDIYRDYVDDTA
jgi:hypothetical protein